MTRRRWIVRSLLAGTPAAAALQAFALEPRWLRTRSLRLAASPTVRFPYFTDIHYKGDATLLEEIVDRIHAASPAPPFAVFGGDLIEESRHLEGALAILGRLRVPLFGVPGNHDYWAGIDFDRVHAALRSRGGAWLVDETVEAPDGQTFLSGFSCVRQAGLVPRPGRRNVAIVHYPVWADRIAPGWDLVLAGHSHGGQVRLPLLGALVKPMEVGRYELGRYTTPAGPLYVSSGVGTFLVDVRFLCPPELVWIEI